MRGTPDPQTNMLCLISPESFVPAAHPIRRIKTLVEPMLLELKDLFDEMYAAGGRPSIPPERLLKSKLLIALYSVRSERLFCEQLGYNFLFRWFLDMDLNEPAFDHSVFSKNQERIMKHSAARVFFAKVFESAREKGWTSDEHFCVDGTLIESLASLKSFAPKDQPKASGDEDKGNPSVDFKGQRRRNDTHQSTTDPESRLYKKGAGKEAKLCFAAHALMENRNGLIGELKVTSPTEVTESRAAVEILQEVGQTQEIQPSTVAGDKGYHNSEFVTGCRAEGIAPHISQIEGRKVEGLDGRTTRTEGYKQSTRCRKKIEEVFGWMKTIGGLRKSRYKGIARTQVCAYWVGAAYNLLRMANLMVLPTG